MLSPAVNLYGWPFVVACLVLAAGSVGVLVWDFRRFCRDLDAAELERSRARHPAGRALCAPSTRRR